MLTEGSNLVLYQKIFLIEKFSSFLAQFFFVHLEK